MNYLVIPAYEPDKKLLTLIKKIKEKSDFHILIIDDGSSEACQPIFEAAKEYATVLHHDVNKGKGQALKTAFLHIKSLDKYAMIVTADADGQHKVWDILRVLRAVKDNPYQLILGVRAFTGKVPFRSLFGNSLTKLLFKLQTGVAVTDTQTGLRGFSSHLLPFMLEVEGERYEYEMNMLMDAAKRYNFVEVPIETVYLDNNSASHFRPVQDGLMIYKNMFKFALSSLTSFAVDYLVYAIMLLVLIAFPISSRILFANGIARLVSSIFNYSTNKKLVFNNQDSLVKTGTGYFGLSLILFTLDTILIQLLSTSLGMSLFLVKILVGGLLFCLSWFIQKKFIFKERVVHSS